MNLTQQNRRSFLVSVGSMLFGPLLIPEFRALDIKTNEIDQFWQSPMATDGSSEEIVIRLAARPTLARNDKGLFMIWTEYYDEDGEKNKARMMWWQPCAEEMDEFNAFYEAAMWRSYSNVEDLRERPRQPGPYVIQLSFAGIFHYVAGHLEDQMRAAELDQIEKRENLYLFTKRVPEEAKKYSHDDAIELTIRLMTLWDHYDMIYWDPVPYDKAVESYRRFHRSVLK